jgi:hypothetical protein
MALPSAMPSREVVPSQTPTVSFEPNSYECESLPREEAMLNALSNVTDRTVLEDAPTPQAMAANWLVSEDPANVDPCSYETLHQRYALVILFFATGGSSWTVNSGWLSAYNECDWSNVECADVNGTMLISKLGLAANNLIGSLQVELEVFASMEVFDVSENDISGSIPKTIGNLQGLNELHLQENALSGPIPSEIGTLDLLSLLAGNNQLTGTVPDDLWRNSKLTSLYLNQNSISGTFSASVGDLPLISQLDLHSNILTGTIPILLGRVSSLELLDLSDNQFTGFIRDSFGTFTSLSKIDLSSNELTGPIPAMLFDLEKIREISLHDNYLDGKIPENLGNPSALERLLLQNNVLSGTVPGINVGQLPNLVELQVQGNSLSGSMPASICVLRNGSTGNLEDLLADCGDSAAPRIGCSVPTCCTQCYPLQK